jgi:hypothetical protein
MTIGLPLTASSPSSRRGGAAAWRPRRFGSAKSRRASSSVTEKICSSSVRLRVSLPLRM